MFIYQENNWYKPSVITYSHNISKHWDATKGGNEFSSNCNNCYSLLIAIKCTEIKILVVLSYILFGAAKY